MITAVFCSSAGGETTTVQMISMVSSASPCSCLTDCMTANHLSDGSMLDNTGHNLQGSTWHRWHSPFKNNFPEGRSRWWRTLSSQIYSSTIFALPSQKWHLLCVTEKVGRCPVDKCRYWAPLDRFRMLSSTQIHTFIPFQTFYDKPSQVLFHIIWKETHPIIFFHKAGHISKASTKSGFSSTLGLNCATKRPTVHRRSFQFLNVPQKR